MAKLSIGQKAARALEFLMGLRNRRVAGTLSAHGFGQDDLDEGWGLMKALTQDRLNVTLPAPLDQAALLALDTWENKWFPIISASLSARFPAAHALVFRNLVQTDGPEVVLSVGTLLTRLEELKLADGGKDALALLARRGIHETIIADAKALLGKLGTIDTTSEPQGGVSPEEEALREAALWAWYLEWSKIARTVISDRRSLRSLGYLDDGGREVAVVTEDEEPIVQRPPAVAPVSGETPRAASPTNGTTSPRPRIAPGMPGASPFIDEEDEDK